MTRATRPCIASRATAPSPGNQTAILVSRGNNAAGSKPEDPGALKLYAFKDGTLTNLA